MEAERSAQWLLQESGTITANVKSHAQASLPRASQSVTCQSRSDLQRSASADSSWRDDETGSQRHEGDFPKVGQVGARALIFSFPNLTFHLL